MSHMMSKLGLIVNNVYFCEKFQYYYAAFFCKTKLALFYIFS